MKSLFRSTRQNYFTAFKTHLATSSGTAAATARQLCQKFHIGSGGWYAPYGVALWWELRAYRAAYLYDVSARCRSSPGTSVLWKVRHSRLCRLSGLGRTFLQVRSFVVPEERKL